MVRLVLPFAVAIALIVAVCGAVIYWAGERQTRLQQVRDLDGLVPLVRQWVAENPALDPASRGRLADAARLLRARITVIAGDGSVLFDTHAGPATMENHNGRPEIVRARQVGAGSGVRHSRTLDEKSVYVAELLDPQKPDGVVVRVSYPQRTWAEFGMPVWALVGGGVVAAVLAVAVFWGVLQRQWITPTRALAEAADRMAAGEWGRRVEPRGADELRAFSGQLNAVAAHAQRQMANLKHQRADLQSLVDTLPDPVLVADAHGKLVLMNPAAAKLLDVSQGKALGQGVVNAVTDEAVLQLFERVRAQAVQAGQVSAAVRAAGGNGSPARGATTAAGSELRPAGGGDGSPPVTREIRLNRSGHWFTYQAVAQRTADGGVLLVLRDITALAATVQMKTDFVANASHELRTPIAAIKIAFETLREVYTEDADQGERCMNIIEGHLRRLEEMLRDLLDMAKVESSTLKPHVKRVKTADVLTHVRASLSTMARQKLVELRLGDGRGDEAVESFLGDERLLNLVLKNLAENSIKFTPPGGSVTIRVREGGLGTAVPGRLVGDSPAAGSGGPPGDAEPPPAAERPAAGPPVIISVADTGIGIPAEHLDRVFERFYQVDPARSGSAGRGTGLGLAIVKHAVAAMGGSVYIDSRPGEGTTVSCVLPQARETIEAEADVSE